MKKRTWAAVLLVTVFLCAAGIAAASYAKEKLIEEAVQEMKRQQDTQEAPEAGEESKPGYILIHTTDGETWGFYGDMEIISDGTGGSDIDIEMTGWVVGSTHPCYNPEAEKGR